MLEFAAVPSQEKSNEVFTAGSVLTTSMLTSLDQLVGIYATLKGIGDLTLKISILLLSPLGSRSYVSRAHLQDTRHLKLSAPLDFSTTLGS